MTYLSDCCDERGKKEPCRRTPEDFKEGKFSQSSLGKWHCSACGKACKVRPVKS